MMYRCLTIVPLLVIAVCLLAGNAFSVLAGAADDFTINLFVGTDSTPPTTPGLLSVTPVAATQIDLVWSAATDDVLLGGYRVYRNGIAIATTSLTTFSDSGLTPVTLYSYFVDAYDGFYNISTTSNVLATTTLPVPGVVPPATTTATSAAPVTSSRPNVPALESFLVTPLQTSASLEWQTKALTAYVLKWGRTTSYEIGSVSSNVFLKNHTTVITDLEPGTKYFFEVTGVDPLGRSRVIKADIFFTEIAEVTSSLSSVEGFTAAVRGSDVDLSWQTSNLPAGAVVRIVRSHLYYPSSITEGSLVYEGRSGRVSDKAALSLLSPQYYSAFVISKEGMVSAGAIAVAGRSIELLPAITEENPVIETGDELVVRASSIVVLQGRDRFTLDAPAPLQADSPYVIYIPVSSVKPGLKSIIVSVQNPTNQREINRYLLKINQSGDAYVATLPAPLVTGLSRIQIEVFDYSSQQVRQITTSVSFVRTANPPVEFPDGLAPSPLFLVATIGIVCAISGLVWWWLVIIFRRRREDNL